MAVKQNNIGWWKVVVVSLCLPVFGAYAITFPVPLSAVAGKHLELALVSSSSDTVPGGATQWGEATVTAEGNIYGYIGDVEVDGTVTQDSTGIIFDVLYSPLSYHHGIADSYDAELSDTWDGVGCLGQCQLTSDPTLTLFVYGPGGRAIGEASRLEAGLIECACLLVGLVLWWLFISSLRRVSPEL